MNNHIEQWVHLSREIAQDDNLSLQSKRALLSGNAGCCFGYGIASGSETFQEAMAAEHEILQLRNSLE